jgi:cell division protein FtsW (lipid II flippase)
MGLGLGSPKMIPAYQTDYIFAVICEEFGIIFGVALIVFYLLFIIRGAIIALGCKEKFYALVAFGCTAFITIQSFMIIAGVIKLIPLTGVTLPFISAGGSSMLSSFALVGLLEGVAIRNGDYEEEHMREAMNN